LGWLGRDVITVLDFTREDLEVLFTEALNMEKYAKSRLNILNGKVLALRSLSRAPGLGLASKRQCSGLVVQ